MVTNWKTWSLTATNTSSSVSLKIAGTSSCLPPVWTLCQSCAIYYKELLDHDHVRYEYDKWWALIFYPCYVKRVLPTLIHWMQTLTHYLNVRPWENKWILYKKIPVIQVTKLAVPFKHLHQICWFKIVRGALFSSKMQFFSLKGTYHLVYVVSHDPNHLLNLSLSCLHLIWVWSCHVWGRLNIGDWCDHEAMNVSIAHIFNHCQRHFQPRRWLL